MVTGLEDCSGRRYILRDRDGDYVETAKSTGMETVKTAFTFTKDRAQARIFSFQDLWWKLATTAIGGQFTQGYAGGKAIRVL